MFKKIKSLFKKSVSTNYIGQILAELLMEEDHDKNVGLIKNKANVGGKEIEIALLSTYLFAYKMVTIRNSLHLSQSILEEIYCSLETGLISISLKNYNNKNKNSHFPSIIEKEVEECLGLYTKQGKPDLTEIVHLIKKSLLIQEDNTTIDTYLKNILYRAITIIQDYLINLSLKRMIISSRKSKKVYK